jgi:hypothetical protein
VAVTVVGRGGPAATARLKRFPIAIDRRKSSWPIMFASRVLFAALAELDRRSGAPTASEWVANFVEKR